VGQKLIKYVDSKGVTLPNLYRDVDTEVFYLRVHGLGKISLETDNFKIAQGRIYSYLEKLKNRKLKAEEKKREEAGQAGEGQNILLRHVYTKMISLKKADDVKEVTLERIQYLWDKSLEPFWGDVRPQDVNQEKVDDFKAWHRRERKGIQLILVFTYLGNLLNICVDYGYLKKEKLPKLELSKTEERHHATKKGRILKHEEFLSITNHLNEKYLIFVKIAYFMGMRKMEIGKLECRRVIKEAGRVYIDLSEFDTKTGIPRTIPVPGFLADTLWTMAKENEQYIFPMLSDPTRFAEHGAIDQAWRIAKAKAKIKGRLRFHDLRHTAATNMARRDINPVLAVTYLGMSLATYQKTYLRLSKEDLLVISESADKILEKPGHSDEK